MKKLTCIIFCLFVTTIESQTIWTGPKITFSKANFADWTLEENQDRITPSVWITRKNSQGIYNIVTESNYAVNSSPADTQWTFGTTADIGSLTFASWQETHDDEPPFMVNKDMVLHLISDDIYIDIKFTFWSSGGTGGFTYERSTDEALSIESYNNSNLIKAHLNPVTKILTIKGLNSKEHDYLIYNISGNLIYKGTVYLESNKIDLSQLSSGIYLLRFNNGLIEKLVVR